MTPIFGLKFQPRLWMPGNFYPLQLPYTWRKDIMESFKNMTRVPPEAADTTSTGQQTKPHPARTTPGCTSIGWTLSTFLFTAEDRRFTLPGIFPCLTGTSGVGTLVWWRTHTLARFFHKTQKIACPDIVPMPWTNHKNDTWTTRSPRVHCHRESKITLAKDLGYSTYTGYNDVRQ